MTDKAARILRKMHWKRFGNPKRRDKILSEFNRSTLDEVGPVGRDEEIKVLKELNEMQDLECDHLTGKRGWSKRKARTSLPGL